MNVYLDEDQELQWVGLEEFFEQELDGQSSNGNMYFNKERNKYINKKNIR